ncbi:hypothetical protein BGY98DRAFT_1081930 [Russula aff. rugulosa BPL654]|nr:hypothetical protein BGY98DRAFT_1081930 [Russula aff. rugulosa BPL654]
MTLASFAITGSTTGYHEIHSLVIGFTLALASGADFESLVTAILFHQIFKGPSLGIPHTALPPTDPQQSILLCWLRPVLALLFAPTTPARVLSGLYVFSSGHTDVGGARGVLCAISVGMLTYAVRVEMLAADIVLDLTLWRASKRRQVVTLVSVALGATGMFLLEIWYKAPLISYRLTFRHPRYSHLDEESILVL